MTMPMNNANVNAGQQHTTDNSRLRWLFSTYAKWANNKRNLLEATFTVMQTCTTVLTWMFLADIHFVFTQLTLRAFLAFAPVKNVEDPCMSTVPPIRACWLKTLKHIKCTVLWKQCKIIIVAIIPEFFTSCQADSTVFTRLFLANIDRLFASIATITLFAMTAEIENWDLQ